MISQKSCIENPHGGGWFSRELKLLPVFFGLIFSFNFIFSDNTSALFVPTLSASVNQANLQVNGNQVINSTSKTTEIPLNLTVNTNNKTGYTATLNSETDETALVNNDSSNGAKINSIDISKTLTNFSQNTWGVKIGNDTNFSPIPKLATPMSVIQTTSKTDGDETNNLEIGLKLGDNLESGNYNNKLIFSILTNNYEHIAIMANGKDFNYRLTTLETAANQIEHFKKSTVAPAVSMNAVNIEDEESDYEIKLWLDPTDKTAYYYTEPEKVYLNTDSSYMFTSGYIGYAIASILDIDLSNFDTSQVTNMNNMFDGMTNLTTLNLSNFNTSKVTNMRFMFFHVSNLTSLNLSNFDTSKVTNMSNMFSGLSSLTSLNLSNFNTSQVTDMGYMFWSMRNLTSLDLSNFDTSKVTNMRGMFGSMHNLTVLNLSNFDTSKVTDMGYMFYDMFNFTILDLPHFDTSKVMYMGRMFALDVDNKLKDKLETIYVNNDFNTANLIGTYEMFANRKKLRGGNGSFLADPYTANKSWLRIDDPAHGRPGYFTRKP